MCDTGGASSVVGHLMSVPPITPAEVERTAERAVTLNITAAQVAELGPPSGPGGAMGRLFRRRR